MHSIYTALLSSGTLSTQGIKGMKVFYDSLFLNFKVPDEFSEEVLDYLLIEKLEFNYETGRMETAERDYLISFGNSGFSEPHLSQGNCYADSVLDEKNKNVVVVGIVKSDTNLSQVISGRTFSGDSYCPLIYFYDINNNALKKVYPLTNAQLDDWNNLVLGNFNISQTPLVSLNVEKSILNIIFRTIGSVTAPSSAALNCIVNVEFDYNITGLTLTNVDVLTGSYQSSLTDTVLQFEFKQLRNYNDNEKIIIGTGLWAGVTPAIFPIKLSTDNE